MLLIGNFSLFYDRYDFCDFIAEIISVEILFAEIALQFLEL